MRRGYLSLFSATAKKMHTAENMDMMAMKETYEAVERGGAKDIIDGSPSINAAVK
jgi:hypothetical protein